VLLKSYARESYFEDFLRESILGKSFESHGDSFGDIGNVLETECFGIKLKNTKHDMEFVETNGTGELKGFNKDKNSQIHISRIDKKKYTESEAVEYAIDKVKTTYLVLGEKCKIKTINFWTGKEVYVDGWKYVAAYKLSNLNESFMREEISIRSDKGNTKYATSMSFKNFWNSFAVHNQI